MHAHVKDKRCSSGQIWVARLTGELIPNGDRRPLDFADRGRHHFVDIHPVLHDDASGGCGNLGKQQTSNPVKYRGGSGEGERNAALHRPFSGRSLSRPAVSVLSMHKEQR
ncbi:hypothetical protein ACMD2_19678 [Ananas comosus]|uniref:Uncharacterized protein n=1 Tax=Ananas comosus TaxID=4615 RepID=A0A199VZS3_ANACO|nr:hypothetical protein ACMD2_19678 [Ananas comosus]